VQKDSPARQKHNGGSRALSIMNARKAGTRTLLAVSLKQQSDFSFSPSAFQASLQTSIGQVPNRTLELS
jgi:hypothetical protein